MTDFLGLHQGGTFVLVNVHDACSAAIAESAGAVALGTTSSGHAHSLARRDAAGALTKSEALGRAEEICATVSVPVSIDAENGWGHAPEDVEATINDLVDIGASGASIEDWSGHPATGIYERSLAVERVQAAVRAAEARPEPFVICARAEAILHGDTDDPLLEAIDRLQLFAEAGAHCVYAPGPKDVATFAKIVNEVNAPVNALINVGSAVTTAAAAEIGIRRISLGGSLFRATMTSFEKLVSQIVETGSFHVGDPTISSPDLERLFQP